MQAADLIDPGNSSITIPSSGFLIAGIGGSAGSIPWFREFFRNVPPDSGIAYVVVLHLSPEYDSQLAEVLQSATSLPVMQVRGAIQVAPDHVYVIPPNRSLSINDGTLELSDVPGFEERRAPIDIFFRTLADTHDSRAVSVILSGSGSDGSLGLRRVKEYNGLVLAQDPAEAEFPEMPRHAIATGLVDFVVPVAEMPARMIAYRDHIRSLPAAPARDSADDEQTLGEIFTLLRTHTGHDFANYKRATVLRRIARRLAVRGLETLVEYRRLMAAEPEETDALLRELLISVTNFFRDKPVWERLEQQVIPALLAAKRAGDPLRVWIAGCATGEEAYSFAMAVADAAARMETTPGIQIFATDVDQDAIAKARNAYYTMAEVADVPPERLRRYFTREQDGYRVRRDLRDLVLFAHHNVIKDPPFARLDLVSCRNLLIYFNRVAQERALRIFHFALRPGGHLLLGSAETTESSAPHFATFDKDHRIFQSRDLPRVMPPRMRTQLTISEDLRRTRVRGAMRHEHGEAGAGIPVDALALHQQLLEEYAPPSLVADEQYDIVHLSARAGRFLEFASGSPSLNLMQVIRPELRSDLQSALLQAAETQTTIVARNLTVATHDRTETVNVVVRPAPRDGEAARAYYLVIFEEADAAERGASQTALAREPAARHLEDELMRVKAQMNVTVEQYAARAEEARSANEELQAMIEELRSTAEELETSQEELQSVNEELLTVNQELKVKIDEIIQTTNDLRNLMSSTEIGTVFVDRELHVKLFTPRARDIFSLMPGDVGRPLPHITSRLRVDDLEADIERVLEELQTIEREVQSRDGRWYLMRLLPYRTDDDRIDGAVLTFVDISARERTEAALLDSQTRLTAALTTAGMAAWSWTPGGEYTVVADLMTDVFGLHPGDSPGTSYPFPFVHPDDRRRHRALIDAATARGEGWHAEFRVVRPRDGAVAWLEERATATRDAAGNVRFTGLVWDITDRKRDEEELREAQVRQTFVLELTDRLRALSDPHDIMTTAAEMFAQHLAVAAVHYSVVDADGTNEIVAIWNDGRLPRLVRGYRTRLSDHGLGWASSLRKGEPVFSADNDTDPRALFAGGAARVLGIVAASAIPLMKDGRVVACLAAAHPEPRVWTEGERLLHREVAERTWAAVERARVEAALRDSEARYRTLFDSMDEGFSIIEMRFDAAHQPVDFRYVEVNPAFERQTGLSDAVGRTARELIPRLESFWIETYGRVAVTGEPTRFVASVIPLGRWFDVNAFRIGRPEDRRVAVLFSDITAPKQAEHALRDSEARLSTIANIVPDLLWSSDPSGSTDWYNDRWCAYTGHSTEDAIGSGWLDAVHPDDREAAHRTFLEASESGDHLRQELRLRNASGEYRWFLAQSEALRNAAGEIVRRFGAATDIHEQRMARESLEERVRERTYELIELSAQRQQLLARLVTATEEERQRIAREVHDEMGQHLTALRVGLDTLQPESESIARMKTIVQRLDQSVDRLAFELRPPTLDHLGLHGAITSLVEEVAAASDLRIDAHLPGVDGERFSDAIETAVYRVVQEALTNVWKHASAKTVSVIVEREEGALRMIVEDDGEGFESDGVLDGSAARGRFGLLGMRERIGLVRGSLGVESQPGSGTTIYVHVPLEPSEQRA